MRISPELPEFSISDFAMILNIGKLALTNRNKLLSKSSLLLMNLTVYQAH